MQASIARQMEAVWSLVDVATFHGQASFKVDGDDLLKRIECFGIRLDFVNGEMVRLRSRNLDINIIRNEQKSCAANLNITAFPLTRSSLCFARGNEETLEALYREVGHLVPHQTAA